MSRGVAFALSVSVAVAVYANSIPNEFAYDDIAIILKNERVHGLSGWREIVTKPYWPAGAGAEAGLYRPVTLGTFALDWALWGGRPQGFHVSNVVAHATATALLLALLLRLFPVGPALAGGLLFAVHPVHTEAVANLVGRAEVLGAAFVFTSLLLLWDREAVSGNVGDGRAAGPSAAEAPDAGSGRRASLPRTAAAGLSYALAILSKEGAIVLPGLLLLTDFAGGRLRAGGRAYLRRRCGAYATLLAVALAVLAIRGLVLGSLASATPADAFVPDASFGTRFFTMIRVWPHYVRLLVAPLDLSASYAPAVVLPVSGWTLQGAFGLGLAVGVFVLGAYAVRRDLRIAAGLGWAAVAILPVSNLLFVTGVVLAERTLYLPSAGLSFVMASIAEQIAKRPRARWGTLAYGLLLAAFAFGTVKRNPDWKNTATLFNSLLRLHPEAYVAHWVLASDLVRRGQLAEAARWYETAYRIWPHRYELIVDFAGHLMRTGQLERAEELAAAGTRLKPEGPAAWELQAAALYRLGRFDEAAQLAERAPQEVRQSHWFAYMVAAALEAAGRPGRAAEWWGRVASAGPSLEAWVALHEVARIQLDRGDTALFRHTLQHALRAATGDSIGLSVLGALSAALSRERGASPAQERGWSGPGRP